MSGEGGSVDDRTAAEVASGVRKLLDEINAGELTCPQASRHRLEGAVVALEAMADSRKRAAPVSPRSDLARWLIFRSEVSGTRVRFVV